VRRIKNHSGEVAYVPEFEGNRADSAPVRVWFRPPPAWQRDELDAAAVERDASGRATPRPPAVWARAVVRACVARVDHYEREDQHTGAVIPIATGEDLAQWGETGLVSEVALEVLNSAARLSVDRGNGSGNSSASERRATLPPTTAAPVEPKASNGSEGASLAP
jgi:hypothetical protein